MDVLVILMIFAIFGVSLLLITGIERLMEK